MLRLSQSIHEVNADPLAVELGLSMSDRQEPAAADSWVGWWTEAIDCEQYEGCRLSYHRGMEQHPQLDK
jgi:hypothetical protein